MSTEGIRAFVEEFRSAFEEGDPHADQKHLEAANVCRIQAIYGAIDRGDWDAFAEGLADDVELEILGPSAIPFVGRHRGRAEVVEATRANFAQLADQRPEVISLVAQGENVTVVLRERGVMRATGKSYEVHATQMFWFRDGKVARFVETFDSAPLLAAMQSS